MPNPKLETYKSKKTGVIYDYTDADAQSKIPSNASSSNKMATASDVASRVDWSSYAKTGVHNMLPIKILDVKSWNGGTWTGNTCVLAGCTFVCHVDDSGYVTQIDVSGTATSDVYFGIYKAYGKDSFLGQNVIMSGCPVGGSSSTYLLTGYRLGSIDGSSGSVIDVGSGVKFDFLNNGSGTRGTITITVLNGVAIPSAVSFYPMIRLSTDTDSTYAPYAMTNKEVTDSKVDWESYAVTGAVNLMRYNQGFTGDNGTKYQLTATGVRCYAENSSAYQQGKFTVKELPKNTVLKFSTDADITTGVARAGIQGVKNSVATDIYFSSYINEDGNISFEFNSGDYDYHVVWLYISSNVAYQGDVTFNNLIITLPSVSIFAPPAMTNRELTEELTGTTWTDITSQLTDIDASVTSKTVAVKKVGNTFIYGIKFKCSSAGNKAPLFKIPAAYAGTNISERYAAFSSLSSDSLVAGIVNNTSVYAYGVVADKDFYGEVIV